MANLGPLRGRADSKSRRSLVWAFVLPVFWPRAPRADSDKFLPEPSEPPRASLSPGNRGTPTNNPRPVVSLYWGPTERRELCTKQGVRIPGSGSYLTSFPEFLC